MSRCGCKAVCSCLLQDGDCTTVEGSGALDNPYKTNVQVVPDGGVECTAGGLIANINVDDTDCILLSGDGGLNPITATPRIIDVPDPNGGPNPGNGVECDPTAGFLVAPSTDPDNAITFGTDGRLHVTAGAVEVDTDQTDCLNLQITGSGVVGDAYVISGNPIIAPEPNGIECTPDGLLVFPSADPNNQLGFGTDDRLFVPPTAVNAVDNAQNIDAIVGPADTITFTCVPVPVTTSVVEDGSPCFSVTGDTCNGLIFELGISPDICNGIECRGNGLFSFYDPTQLPPRNEAGFGFGPQVFNGVVNPVVIQGPCVSITNPSPCRNMEVSMVSGINTDYQIITGVIRTTGFVSFDGGANYFPGANTLIGDNHPGGNSLLFATGGTVNGFVLAPGATATFCGRLQIDSVGSNVNTARVQATMTLSITGTGWSN